MTELQNIITRLQELQAKLPEKPKPILEFAKKQIVYDDTEIPYTVVSYDGTVLKLHSRSGAQKNLRKSIQEGWFSTIGHYGMGGTYSFYNTPEEASKLYKVKFIEATIARITTELDALDKRLA